MNYEKVFAINLGKKLAERIYGKVVIEIVRDKVHVRIQCWNDIDCVIVLDNFSERILNGWSTDYACYEVITEYRKIVMKRYFK